MKNQNLTILKKDLLNTNLLSSKKKSFENGSKSARNLRTFEGDSINYVRNELNLKQNDEKMILKNSPERHSISKKALDIKMDKFCKSLRGKGVKLFDDIFKKSNFNKSMNDNFHVRKINFSIESKKKQEKLFLHKKMKVQTNLGKNERRPLEEISLKDNFGKSKCRSFNGKIEIMKMPRGVNEYNFPEIGSCDSLDEKIGERLTGTRNSIKNEKRFEKERK